MTAGAATRSHPWLALQVTLAVQVFATFVLATGPVLAPAVMPALGLPPERVGLFVATAYFFAMVSGLVAGPWVERVGAMRMTRCVLLTVAAGAVVATAGIPAVLLLAATVIGLGYGMTNPAATSILGRHAPTGSPGLFFALKQAGVPIGVGLAGLAMPLALAAWGWRGAVWAVAAACVLLAAGLVPAGRRLDPAERGPVPQGASWVATLRMVLGEPALRRLSLMSMAYNMAQQGFLTYAVSVLALERGLPLVVAAALLSASQVACTIVRIVLGHVADRWIAPRVLLGALGLGMAASCLLLGWMPAGTPVPLVALVMVLTGATAMGWNGVFFAQLLRTVPRERLAASAGGTQFFTFAGGFAGPFLFAQLLQAGGSYAAGYSALALLAGCAGAWMLRR